MDESALKPSTIPRTSTYNGPDYGDEEEEEKYDSEDYESEVDSHHTVPGTRDPTTDEVIDRTEKDPH